MARNNHRIHQTRSDALFDAINIALLWIVLIVVLYPLIYIISCSFSDSTAVISGQVWLWPVQPTLLGYTAVFSNSQVITGYANSLFYVLAGTAINLVVTFMAAYPLARKGAIKGQRVVMFLFMFTVLFSGGMIPSFLLVNRLGMVNTRWALIVPRAMTVWNVIITRTFLKTSIPEELYESAQLDGSGECATMFRIVLPLSGAIIAVNALFYAVGHWNAYFDAMIYLRNQALFPLQIVLRNILIMNNIDSGMISDVRIIAEKEALRTLLKYSLIVVASVPVMVLYPFVQKFFVKGVMIGSVKG